MRYEQAKKLIERKCTALSAKTRMKYEANYIAKRGCEMTIAAFETYLNEWSSAYTVYIAVTEGDVKKLWDKWYEFVEANEQSEEETL